MQLKEIMPRSTWKSYVETKPVARRDKQGYSLDGLAYVFAPPRAPTRVGLGGDAVDRFTRPHKVPEQLTAKTYRKAIRVENWGSAPFSLHKGILIPNEFKCKTIFQGLGFIAETRVVVEPGGGSTAVLYRISHDNPMREAKWAPNPSCALMLTLWDIIEAIFINIIELQDNNMQVPMVLYVELGRLVVSHSYDKSNGKIHLPVATPIIQARINEIFTPMPAGDRMAALVEAALNSAI